jgi:hypothetical protein
MREQLATCGVFSAKPRVEPVGHVQFHHTALAYARLIRSQIDIVVESEFPSLLRTILQELKTIQTELIKNYAPLLERAIADKKLVRHLQIRAQFSGPTG